MGSSQVIRAAIANKVQEELWGKGPYPPRTIVEVHRLNQDDILDVEGTFYAPVRRQADCRLPSRSLGFERGVEVEPGGGKRILVFLRALEPVAGDPITLDSLHRHRGTAGFQANRVARLQTCARHLALVAFAVMTEAQRIVGDGTASSKPRNCL
jgi:hypothetical protein